MTLPGVSNADLARSLTPLERTVLILSANARRVPEVARRAVLEKALRDYGVTPEDVPAIVEGARQKIAAIARRKDAPRSSPAAGNPVTIPGTLPGPPVRRVKMKEPQEPVVPAEANTGFVAKIQQEAEVEARRVLAEADRVMEQLDRLRFEAHQVAHVMRALRLQPPRELDTLLVPGGHAAVPSAPAEAPAEAAPPKVRVELRRPPKVEAPAAPVEPPAAAPKAEEPQAPAPVRAEAPKVVVSSALSGMPAMQVSRPTALSVAAAQRQRAVLDAVESAGRPIVPEEIAETVAMSNNYVRTTLEELAAAALILRTGVMRRGAARESGRTAHEFRALVAPKQHVGDVVTPEALAAVRDFVTAHKTDLFSVGQVAEAMRLDHAVVVSALAQLEQRGVVSDQSPAAGMTLYGYVKPDGPGKAAQIDAQRARQVATTNGNGSDPVPGTGGGVKTGNSLSQQLVNAVVKAGGRAEKTKGDHIRIFNAEGRSAIIAATPGNSGFIKDKANLRRLGIPV